MQLLSLYLPGIIIAFREWMESFLIVLVLLRFLEKTGNTSLKKNVWRGMWIGITLSLLVGGIFIQLWNLLNASESIWKIWESSMSLVAVWLIVSFILWMIRNGKHIKSHIENEAQTHLSSWWILLMTTVMIAREGVEISVFAYAWEYPWQSILYGIIAAILVSLCMYKFSSWAKLTTLLTITLGYLILQAGYLLGYSVHEGLSALKELKVIDTGNPLLLKAFDLSNTVLSHKEWIIWVPLNILFGWYSKPEWIQFITQHLCVAWLLWMWIQTKHHRQ